MYTYFYLCFSVRTDCVLVLVGNPFCAECFCVLAAIVSSCQNRQVHSGKAIAQMANSARK